MSNGVESRLNYLEETKSIIKDSINNIGGTLTDESLFKEYPSQIQTIIDETIISQEALEVLIDEVEEINGEEVN